MIHVHKLLFGICVVLLMACAFVIMQIIHNEKILRDYQTRPIATAQSLPLPELPALKAQDNTIIRTDTGARVILKGVTSDFFRNPLPARTDEQFYEDLQLAKRLGSNCVGFIVAIDTTDNNLKFLDNAITYLTDQRMYTILMPEINHKDGSYPNIGKPLGQLLEKLANRYGSNQAVMFGLGAEPFGPTSTAWGKRQSELATIVRAIAPQSLVFLTGTNYGKDFEYLNDPNFHIDNAVVYITDYPLASPHKNDPVPQEKVMNYASITHMYPLFVGEFGGVYNNGFGSDTDLFYIRDQIIQANSLHLGYTMYRLEPMTDYLTGLAIQSVNNSVTKRGEILRDDLMKNPPTKF